MAGADDVIINRLKLLAEYIDELHWYRAQASDFQLYADNKLLRRAAERSLQLAVEICLDIGRRIIALEGFRYPDDNQDVFRILAQEKVIPSDLVATLLEMARFRNLLVHDYVRVDDVRVYDILQKRVSDFDAFAKAVASYVGRR